MPTLKKQIILRAKLLHNFILKNDYYFLMDQYHIVNRLEIELERFLLEIKKIHYSKFKKE